jgi:hypothetical protein
LWLDRLSWLVPVLFAALCRGSVTHNFVGIPLALLDAAIASHSTYAAAVRLTLGAS